MARLSALSNAKFVLPEFNRPLHPIHADSPARVCEPVRSAQLRSVRAA
jgi:hypothetical protein